jgi:hypothetical protein
MMKTLQSLFARLVTGDEPRFITIPLNRKGHPSNGNLTEVLDSRNSGQLPLLASRWPVFWDMEHILMEWLPLGMTAVNSVVYCGILRFPSEVRQ